MDCEKKPVYNIKTEQYDVPFWDYYDMQTTFGHFANDGESYVITDNNTPRQWFGFLVNDSFGSVVSNRGEGLTGYGEFCRRVTKFDSETDYMLRQANGRRGIFLTDLDSGRRCDLLFESDNYTCRITPGKINFTGDFSCISFDITMFVPVSEPMECWCIKLKNNGSEKRNLRLEVSQDWSFQSLLADDTMPQKELEITLQNGLAIAKSPENPPYRPLYGFFFCKDTKAQVEAYSEERIDTEPFCYHRASLSCELSLGAGETLQKDVFSGACEEGNVWEKCAEFDTDKALSQVEAHWKTILQRNHCELPDKNLQYFLNTWLKNQVYLTYRYNRFGQMGYRDVLQDSWGYMLVEPERAKEKIAEALSKMYSSGRCPRQYDRMSDRLDTRDFSDSPVWCPTAVDSYIKETGDMNFLFESVPYIDNSEVTTVEEHIWRSLDNLYRSRGENGLILMRGGDWLDGLGGLNKYGPATSTWLTMAAYQAQNIMAGIYRRIGDMQKADIMEKRSLEYKEIVNRVSWDGNWYTYGFMGDGSPIGSHKNLEGKIYLNPQTWAMLTGIVDSKEKVKKMRRAINVYLTCPYGPQLMYPPYVLYGEKMGRLQKQRPGTFANGAVYLHAASFKVFADIAVGECDDALDTLRRIMPNHPDNPDKRRTSEPYCVGNVHYGVMHPKSGMNLYSWFSATPSWLIHAGFEQLLGVKADFDGIAITPHEIDGFDNYSVTKHFRGTVYNIEFTRQAEKGIWVDGEKIEGNIVYSDKQQANVKVGF